MTTREGWAGGPGGLTLEHAAGTPGRVGGVARAYPGSDRLRAGTLLALAVAGGTPDRVCRAGGGHGGDGLDQRDPRASGRSRGQPAAGQSGAGRPRPRGSTAAAASSLVPDAGLAGRLACPAAQPAAARRLVGRLA